MLALEQALRIVRADGEICVLNCVGAGGVPYLGGVEPLSLLERIQNAGIKHKLHVKEGDPKDEIPLFAVSNKCDIIVGSLAR